MTHEAGIEEAAEMLVIEMSPDAPDMQGARHSARFIVEAYLSASGMVLVPKSPTLHMVLAGDKVTTVVFDRDECRDAEIGPTAAENCFQAMVSAAPNPFKSKPDEIGRCGECKTEGWVKGELFPPCDDSYCTFSYWEPIKP